MEIKVSRTVQVELERVDWKHMTWAEDYYIRMGDRTLGIASKYDTSPSVGRPEYWIVTATKPECPEWDAARPFKTRDAAVAAFVRYAAKQGVI